MPFWLTTAIVGVAAGAAASLAMNLYQGATASAFGQDGGGGDPATVKAADTVSETIEGPPVTQKRRGLAGSAMHYGLGIALGVGYAFLVPAWPVAAIGFGAAFGLVVMLLLDDLLVPLMGWGGWTTSVATHLYSATSHVVFGVVLEGVRRWGGALLAGG